MALLTLQMALGSSSQAAAGTLRKIAEHPKLAAADRERLDGPGRPRRRAAREHQGRPPARARRRVPRQDGHLHPVPGHPGDAPAAAAGRRGTTWRSSTAACRGWRRRRPSSGSAGPARLLLCTEAGSEGRNLQFAHAVCNFDLPWNPMKIEQRIGRLSRIGQTHDVHVFNLVAAGTVEAAVLHLLEAKLNMFELVIGEIDMILGNLDDEREFQDVVADLWAESDDADDFARRIDALGDRLLEAKRAYLRQRSHDDRLFGNRFAPEGLTAEPGPDPEDGIERSAAETNRRWRRSSATTRRSSAASGTRSSRRSTT